MADDRLDCPPFPPLRWEDYFWVGEIRLPSWAGFQARRGAYSSVSSSKPSDGSAEMTLSTGQRNDRGLPTPEQIAAYRHLVENEAVVANVIGQALVDYYQGEKDAYWSSPGKVDTGLTVIRVAHTPPG
jgi:hypothetical protein